MSQPTSLQPPAEAPRPSSPTLRKRKLRRWMPQKKARRRMKEYAGLASQMLQLALTVAAGSASDAGVPGLSSGLQALLEFLKKIQAMKTNVEGVETLAKHITELKDALEKLLVQHQQLPNDMQERIDALCKLWEQIAEDAQHIKCRGMIKRFFTSNVDAAKLQDLVQKVNQSIQDFMVQALLAIEANLYVVRQDVKAIRTQQEMALLSTYAKNAHYNSSSVRRECLEGTRKEVLADAYTWIHESSKAVATSTAEEQSGHFLWINGWAGTGKTTIACSIAKKYDAQGTLGADFFCSRSDAECRDPKSIFVTIARQLCQYHEPFKEKVVAILREKPDIVHLKPREQFENLILQPLRDLGGKFPTCVIVIDALDECQNEGIVSEILCILADHIRELAPFIFVVTSRPEAHITTFFEKENATSLKDSTKPVNLNNVHLDLTQEDIKQFFINGFREIRRVWSIEEKWPSSRDVNRLAELSDGLFIFAATVLRFIDDPDYSNPKKQLQALLAASVSIMHDLYLKILELAYKKVHTLHETNPSLRRVLGAITLLEEPLSVPALASLLGMAEGDVRNTLSRLRAVVHFPEEGSGDPIRFIHPTFPEFLLSTSMVKPEAFRIDPTEHHLTLFTQSLVAMDSLTRNIAGIERPAAFRSEIPGLADIVKTRVPAHVAYACRFWSAHLSRCVGNTLKQEHRDLLGGFLSRQMLYWLEACSLLRILDGALAALETARRTCQDVDGPFGNLMAPLADYYWFLWTYYYCIDTAPLQVYHSALALAPTESFVRKAYGRELGGSLNVRRGALSKWPARRDAFTGHDGKWVSAIAFSPGGEYFITGGGDKRLKMWKTTTRAMVQSFDGHTNRVRCVAFSPDGVHVASGSDDQDVRVWQVSSGDCVHILKGHSREVSSVTYSADGRRLLSATVEGEVKLWDTSHWRCILTLNQTGNWTLQAGLSPDCGVVARGSGASLSLHDVSSATDEAIDFPDRVEACTFSPDGRYIAARSFHVIRIWQCADKSLVRSITVSDSLHCRLAFSRDGTRIACALHNGSVSLWHVASEDPPLVIEGHTKRVLDVAWSPDGLQVASASWNGVVRVCDAVQSESSAHTEEPIMSQPCSVPYGPPQFALTRHEAHTVLLHLPTKVDVTHFGIAPSMPEGAPKITLFTDMVDAWDAVLQVVQDVSRLARPPAWPVITGHQHVDFSTSWTVPGYLVTFHSRTPSSISPDGLLLAYQSLTSKRTVDVCNLHTGQVAVSFTGHSDPIFSMAFSPDSALIATGSVCGSVKVWKIATGDVVHNHQGHTDAVSALAFSSDGCLVATGSVDKSVHVFEAEAESVKCVFANNHNAILEVGFTPDDKCVLALDLHNWVHIWDIVTGMRTHSLSAAGASWTRSLVFSSDDTVTDIPVEGHDLEARPLPICDTGSRTWPAYAVSNAGWVYARSPGHAARLCWLPQEWCKLVSWDGARFCCLDVERRTTVEFDVSCLPEYIQNWGS